MKQIISFTLLMLVMLLPTTPSMGGTSRAPNVIVFYVDDLDFSGMGAGYDLMELPSSERLLGGSPKFPVIVTPNTDRLVAEGLIFDRFYITSPICTPSRYSLLTGTYASSAASLRNDFAPEQTVHNIVWDTFVEPGQYNLSKMFKSAGYRTGIFGKMHSEEAHIKMRAIYRKYSNENPLSLEAMAEITAGHREFVSAVKEIYDWDVADRVYSENADAFFFPPQLKCFNLDWCTQGALEFIEESGEQPFFLYFPLNFPHGVSGAGKHRFSESMRRGTPAGLLDEIPGVLPDIKVAHQLIRDAGGNPNKTDSLTMVDFALGAIDKKLRETGNFKNTVFIYLSDHQAMAKNSPHEGARVPCVIRWPEKIKKQRRTDALCANIDLLPTLAELSGAAIPAAVSVDGQSFAPLLAGDSAYRGHEAVFLEVNYARSMIKGDYKYIEYFAPDKRKQQIAAKKMTVDKKGNETRIGWHGQRYRAEEYFGNYFDPVQLVNLKTDPFERENLATNPEYQPLMAKMRTELLEHIDIQKVAQEAESAE